MYEYITKEAAIEVFEWGDADVIEDYGDGCDFGFSRGASKAQSMLSLPLMLPRWCGARTASTIATTQTVYVTYIRSQRQMPAGIPARRCV